MLGLISLIFLIGISMPPYVNFLVLLVGFMVLDYAGRKLNPVRHEFLHLWRIFVAC